MPGRRPGAAPLVATFSIVAAEPSAGDWGVAVASKFPAVGAVVPWARAGVGAIATQAWANVAFGPEALSLLGRGGVAKDVLGRILEGDDGRERRQVGLVDAAGTAATFTGSGCMEWAGGLTGDGFACQGNILAGPQVVERMAEAYRGAEGELVDRLLAALEAAEDAGGDRRGRQSAALLVAREGGGYDARNDRYIDLRVDDHAEPVRELRRIFTMFDREYLVRNDQLLSSSPALVEEIQRRLHVLGHHRGAITGALDEETREALSAFAGENNLEGRLRTDDLLSEALIRELRDVTPGVG